MKKEKEHLMLQEILEQERVIRDIVKKYVDFNSGITYFEEFKHKLRELRKVDRVTFLGCGTSYHAAIYGNYIFEEFVDLPCEVEFADEFLRRKTVIETETMFIFFSQSGETTDIISAAKKAKESKCLIVGITNNINSTLAHLADVAINTLAGKEDALAATKTFSSQLIILALLAVYIGGLNRKPPTISKRAIEEIKVLPEKIKNIFSLQEKIIKDLQEKEASLILIATKGNKDFKFKDILYIPESLEIFNPILSVIILQFFAYFLALEKRMDMDKPRNLSKFI